MSSTHSYHQMQPIPPNYNHVVPTTYLEGRPELPSRLQLEISKTKKRVHAVRMLSKTGSVMFNSIIFTIMTFVTSIFLSTRHDEVNNRNVWPADTKAWPTYMLLTASLVTLALEIFILCVYCFRYSRAEKSWKLVLVEHLAHFLLWLVITFLYRYERALNDVWGWSCSGSAKTLQEDLNNSVNFARLCGLQKVSWFFSIIETVAKVLFAVLYFIMFRRAKVVESKLKLADGVGDGVSQLLQGAF